MITTQASKRVYTGEDLCTLPPEELKSFYHNDVSVAFAASQSNGFSALWMPGFLDERLAQPDDHDVWNKWSFTPSAFVNGYSPAGNHVSLVTHVPSLTPGMIAAARHDRRLVDGAVPVTNDLVYGLLKQEGNGVFVLDRERLLHAPVGWMSVDQTLDHVLTTPFCGSDARAQQYVPRHNERYNRVGVWFNKADLSGDVPAASLLLAGGVDVYLSLLVADDYLNRSGRFFSVRTNSAAGADAEKK